MRFDSGGTLWNVRKGYFPFYRSQFDEDDPLYKLSKRRKDGCSYLEGWNYVLSITHYSREPSELIVQGQVVKVGRGQFVISQRELADRMGWGRQKARSFLSMMVRLGRIQPIHPPTGQPSVSHYRVVTYDAYNGHGSTGLREDNPPSNPPRSPDSTHTQPYPIKNKNGETDPGEDGPPSAAAPLPFVEPVPLGTVLSLWNDTASNCGLARVRQMTLTRKKALRARWRDDDWRDHYADALANIPDCPFLLEGGGGTWRANFDWFIRPDSVTRILEGAYDGKAGANRPGSTRRFSVPQSHRDAVRALEEADRRRASEPSDEQGGA